MSLKDIDQRHPARADKTIEELQQKIEALEAELEATKKITDQLHGFRVVATHTSNSVLIVDTDGIAQWINPSFERLSGLTFNEIVGKTTGDFLVGPDTELETIKNIWEQMKARQSFTYEVTHYNSQDQPYQIITNGEPILCENGELLGYAMIETDITLLKVMEEALASAHKSAEEKERAKANLLANLSHEFRTPLNGILGLGHLLLDTPLNDEQTDYTKTIIESGDILRNLIENLLSMATTKVDHETDHTKVDLRKSLTAKFCQHEEANQNKDLKFDLNIASDVPAEILIPWGAVQKTLHYLCENAVKFTHAGCITMTVDMESASSVRFAISDTGVGIHPDILPYIFDEYYQGDESHTRQHGGIGLGLPLARKLANSIGSDIIVESTLGQGSTFSFCAPIQPEPVN